MNSIDTNHGTFNLPNKIDDTMDSKKLIQEDEEPEGQQEFEFPQMMYHPPPQFQFSPPVNEKQSTSIFSDGDNKMYFIILFVAFILGFFMGKTMQPIIIRST